MNAFIIIYCAVGVHGFVHRNAGTIVGHKSNQMADRQFYSLILRINQSLMVS